jgi:hypothetical protein
MDIASGTIRAIVFQDNGVWVAQCLEHDIGAQADDLDTLAERLEIALKIELKESMEQHREPFHGIAPAPDRFFRMWERRARSFELNAAPWMTSGNKTKLNLALVA